MNWYEKAKSFENYDAAANAAHSALLKLRYITDQNVLDMDISYLVNILVENDLVPTEHVSPERFAAMIRFLASQNGVLPEVDD